MQETPPLPRDRSRLVRPALILILLMAFALRTLTLDAQSLWRDEIDAVFFAWRPLRETLSMFSQMAQNGPLYFLSLRPWLMAVGSTEFALRYPSALAGVLALPLIYQVTRALLGPSRTTPALVAALFLASNPYALWYGQEGKMYAVVLALALAATWCWLRGVARGGWAWVGYFVFVSVALYTHLLAILIIPLHMLWFVIAWPTARRHWKGYALALAALILPWIPMLLWQWDMLRAADIVTGFQRTPLLEMAKTTWANQLRGFVFTDHLWGALPAIAVGAVGLILGMTVIHQDESAPGVPGLPAWRVWLLILAWAAAPLLFIWLVSLRQPVFTDRYLIWSLPATMILLAIGVEVVRDALGRAGPLVAALAIGLIVGAWLVAGFVQMTSPVKYDLRSAVEYVAQRRSPDDLLVLQIPHQEYAYRYYTGDRTRNPFVGSDARLGAWMGGLWTNYGAGDAETTAEVDRQMTLLTTGHDRIWLMLSEPEMWDRRRLMDKWLSSRGQVIDSADFRGVQVRQFDMQ